MKERVDKPACVNYIHGLDDDVDDDWNIETRNGSIRFFVD